MSRSRIVQGARSAEGIPGICDVTKMCDWRICQSISQTSSDLAVLAHGTLYRNMLSTMCIESSPLDVNSTTIYMGTAIREYELSILLKS